MPISQENSNKISVAYSGVHSIYHIAQAAYEHGLLDRFYCSIADSPGKWGGVLSSIAGANRLANRRRREIPSNKISEYPWPLLKGALAAKKGKRPVDWFAVNDQFDQWVAANIRSSSDRVFVGAETCALRSFVVGRQKGMKLVLDCPQLHPTFLADIEKRSAEDLGLSAPSYDEDSPMERRKSEEFAMADMMLMLSDFQKRTFIEQGFDADKMNVTFFWPDNGAFVPPSEEEVLPRGRKLRVLYVGALSLRKGITYMLRAAKQCASEVELTMVGPKSGETDFLVKDYTDYFTYIPPVTKMELRDIYCQSDVLVMPSIAEAYGWVAMEAMACGTPIIVSENCGSPVPDESWRVPIMNHNAITERLLMYSGDRELCRQDGRRALEFSKQWTSHAYRAKVGQLLESLLN